MNKHSSDPTVGPGTPVHVTVPGPVPSRVTGRLADQAARAMRPPAARPTCSQADGRHSPRCAGHALVSTAPPTTDPDDVADSTDTADVTDLGDGADLAVDDHRPRPEGPSDRTRQSERGQSTVEYALLLLGAAAIALVLVAWVTKTDMIGRLFDTVIGRILDQA